MCIVCTVSGGAKSVKQPSCVIYLDLYLKKLTCFLVKIVCQSGEMGHVGGG